MEKISDDEYDEYSKDREERFGTCQTCKRYNTTYSWCRSCDPKRLTEGWTSGNESLDEIIKSTQLRATCYNNELHLQWIPYDDIKNIEKIGEGGFATIYKATWLNGFKGYHHTEQRRVCSDREVALKKIHNSQNVLEEILNEFKNYALLSAIIGYTVRVYGLTQDPKTKEYLFVMNYSKHGNLHNFLSKNFNTLNWCKKTRILEEVIIGLRTLHQKKIIHRDLHSGNILIFGNSSFVSDLGLSVSANQTSTSNVVVGVLPYLAPEVLNGKPYTMASDIYSFGVLMSVVSTGLQPFNNIAHGPDLAIKICEGIRPGFSNNTPQFYIELAYRCMDANPDKRPTVEEVEEIISYLARITLNTYFHPSLPESIDKISKKKEFDKMDKILFEPSTITTTVHPNAVYTSRLLNFTNLPQPVNSNKVTIISNYDTEQIELSLPDD